MLDPIITCPHCRGEVKLTEAMAAPLVEATRRQFQKQIADKDAEIASRESAMTKREQDLEAARAAVDAQVQSKLDAERKKIAAEEAQRAKRLSADDLAKKAKEIDDLNTLLQDSGKKLTEAQEAQAEFMKKERALDEEKRSLNLTIEKRVNESLDAIRTKAKQDADEESKLRVAEKEQQIQAMARQIEDLKRRAEQGSQQLQGEVLELQLEELLRDRFPHDAIEPVPKGEFGGDIVHRVVNPLGVACGSILWEIKRTKNWSDAWLAKVRGDMRAAKADAALIVSQALPKGVDTFDHIDGVWVTDRKCAIPVALALRSSLLELAHARQAREGQQGKMELIYEYLMGPRFKHRVEAIVEKFSDMQADLEKERRTMTRLWAKRQQQIQGVIESTFGMYGDLQGIAGTQLQEIKGLELPLLEADDGL